MRYFQYCVCSVQGSRVTFVNGQWQGKLPANPNDPGGSLNSCPFIWEYLQLAGGQGWDLVSTLPLTNVTDEYAAMLFLKRAYR